YQSLDTWRELSDRNVCASGPYRPDGDCAARLYDRPARFLDALADYDSLWFAEHGRHIEYHLVGHSEGAMEALAIASYAESRGGPEYDDLIGSVVAIDGAVHPLTVIADLQPSQCFSSGSWWDDPVDTLLAGSDIAFSLYLAGADVAAWFEDDEVAADVNRIHAAGTRVATVTNSYDLCLSQRSTLTTADPPAITDVFDVPADVGVLGHRALLAPGQDEDPGKRFPIRALIEDMIGRAGISSPGSAASGSGPLDTGPLGSFDGADGFEDGTLGGLRGYLSSPDDLPIRGQLVLEASDGSSISVGVASSGWFDTHELTPGDYTVYVNPFGDSVTGQQLLDEADQPRSITIVGGEYLDLGVVKGAGSYDLAVTLESVDGPIEGIVGLADSSGILIRVEATDGNGHVTLADLALGDYTVYGAAWEGAVQTQPLELISDDEMILVLPEAETLTVTVTDLDGAPVLGAVVYVTLDSGEKLGALTDPDGKAMFGALPTGAYTVSAATVDSPDTILVSTPADVTTEGGDVEISADFSLPPELAANDDAFDATENETTVLDVLTNDTGEGLTVVDITQPTNGATLILSGTTIEYTPTTDYTGTDEFEYTIENSTGQTASASV
ncbi:MAG: carboxypeptidase regulatory-like domain-containing protein, partial [Actinomycetota bacterium]|nr:carboxypeptidase regulatory-like domain-containing protein [Actinomycetota bacterium]